LRTFVGKMSDFEGLFTVSGAPSLRAFMTLGVSKRASQVRFSE